MPDPVLSVTAPTIMLSVAWPKLEVENSRTTATRATAKICSLRSVLSVFMCLLLVVYSLIHGEAEPRHRPFTCSPVPNGPRLPPWRYFYRLGMAGIQV